MTAPAGAPGRGDGVAELVALMDLLRSPGGCPWDRAQTHESLVPYALEEAYEVAEAIETGDRTGLREELGDLLLQVVFHARVAQEHDADPFDLDDVARGITAKLIRRHPHVFEAPAEAPADELPAEPLADGAQVRWEQLKQVEKQRTSVVDGIPLAQGALARGQKVLARARRSGVDVDIEAVARRHADAASTDAEGGPGADDVAVGAVQDRAALGARLLLLVAEAEAAGVDAESALRAAARALENAVRLAEGVARATQPG